MADFDPTKLPELIAQRLEATAVDCSARAQTAFGHALTSQRELLGILLPPTAALMKSTASRVGVLASRPARSEQQVSALVASHRTRQATASEPPSGSASTSETEPATGAPPSGSSPEPAPSAETDPST